MLTGNGLGGWIAIGSRSRQLMLTSYCKGKLVYLRLVGDTIGPNAMDGLRSDFS